MQPYFFEWMLNEGNLFLNLFYYLLTRGYWLPESQGGNLSGKVALHVQGWKLKECLRDAWGERLSWGCSFIQKCCDPESCGESRAARIILGRSVGGWGVPWEAHTESGFETPTVHLKYVVCVISDTEVSLKSSHSQWRGWLRVWVTSEHIGGMFSSSFQKM